MRSFLGAIFCLTLAFLGITPMATYAVETSPCEIALSSATDTYLRLLDYGLSLQIISPLELVKIADSKNPTSPLATTPLDSKNSALASAFKKLLPRLKGQGWIAVQKAMPAVRENWKLSEEMVETAREKTRSANPVKRKIELAYDGLTVMPGQIFRDQEGRVILTATGHNRNGKNHMLAYAPLESTKPVIDLIERSNVAKWHVTNQGRTFALDYADDFNSCYVMDPFNSGVAPIFTFKTIEGKKVQAAELFSDRAGKLYFAVIDHERLHVFTPELSDKAIWSSKKFAGLPPHIGAIHETSRGEIVVETIASGNRSHALYVVGRKGDPVVRPSKDKGAIDFAFTSEGNGPALVAFANKNFIKILNVNKAFAEVASLDASRLGSVSKAADMQWIQIGQRRILAVSLPAGVILYEEKRRGQWSEIFSFHSEIGKHMPRKFVKTANEELILTVVGFGAADNEMRTRIFRPLESQIPLYDRIRPVNAMMAWDVYAPPVDGLEDQLQWIAERASGFNNQEVPRLTLVDAVIGMPWISFELAPTNNRPMDNPALLINHEAGRFLIVHSAPDPALTVIHEIEP